MMIDSQFLMNYLVNVTPLISIQLVLLLLLRGYFRNYLGAENAYSFWLLLPLWNLLLLTSWVTAERFGLSMEGNAVSLPAMTTIINDTFIPVLDESTLIVGPGQSFLPGTSAWQWTFLLWGAGFSICTLYRLALSVLTYQAVKTSSNYPADESLLADIRAAGFPRNLKIKSVDKLYGPAIFGVINPVLLLPTNFMQQFSRAQRHAILSHEFVHYSRRDNLVNVLTLVLQMIFWFNPLAYLTYRAMRIDQEISCDHIALGDQPPAGRKAYAEALLLVANTSRNGGQIPGISFWGSKRELLERTKLIANFNKRVVNVSSRRIVVASFVLAGTFLSISINPFAIASTAASGAPIQNLEAELIPDHFIETVAESETRSGIVVPTNRGVIPADSDYLAFVLDTSGSMTNNSAWQLLLEKIPDIMSLYPNLLGFQIMNDMGDYLYDETRDEWIPFNQLNVDETLSDLSQWNPYSNSSPLEGIARVINSLGGTQTNISVYVMGDDLQPETVLEEVLQSVQTINRSSSEETRLVRIHGVMFPTLFSLQERFQGSAYSYLALMRSLTSQNGGSFELLPDFQ